MYEKKIGYVMKVYMLNSKQEQNYYNESIKSLIEYISNSETNPNEPTWNRYAVKNKLLSAESIGYIHGKGFNKLCKEIRKRLKNRN